MASPVRPLSEVIEITIASGQSLSDPVNMLGRVVTAVLVPSAWTSADITFQGSIDGVTYGDLHNPSGEYGVTGTAGALIAVDAAVFFGVNYIRVRSGTSASAVNQAAARVISLASAVPDRQ